MKRIPIACLRAFLRFEECGNEPRRQPRPTPSLVRVNRGERDRELNAED